jgi:hypothetical protein
MSLIVNCYMALLFPDISKAGTTRPSQLTMSKLRYRPSERNSRFSDQSPSLKVTTGVPMCITSLSPVQRSIRRTSKLKGPRACFLSDVSKLSQHRTVLLWTRRRAEPLSPLSAYPEGQDLPERLELEGLRVMRSVEGRPQDYSLRMSPKRSKPRPLELEIPSVCLHTEMVSDEETPKC